MPTTTEIVNWVKQTAPGWNRVGELGILEVMNEVQNMLMQQESQQQIIYVDDDFPLLVTQDEVYEYDIDTTNVPTLPSGDAVWRVGMVLLKVPINEALRVVILGEYGLGPEVKGPIDKYRFNGKEYFRFQQVSSVDSNYSDKAKVRFSINPGDTTDDFYVLMYKGCTQLTSETVALSIPERLHIRIFMPAVVKFIEALQNNTWDKAVETMENVYMRRMASELNAGEQGISHSVQRRRI